MARFNFPSLASNQYAFTIDTMNYRSCEVDGQFQRFDTLGDGMCAHSPSYPIQRDVLPDFLFSLAAHLLVHPEDVSSIGYRLRADNGDAKIAFARSIVFREKGKQQQYYSLQDQKVSASESKRHDRRYEKVEPWMDGSYKSVTHILYKEFHSAWAVYLLHAEVRDWFSRVANIWEPLPALALDWTKDHNVAREIEHALEIVSASVKAADCADNARRGLANYKSNLERASAPQKVEMAS
jgi:hypothetical protein